MFRVLGDTWEGLSSLLIHLVVPKAILLLLCVWDACSGFDINSCQGLKLLRDLPSGIAVKSVEAEIMWILLYVPSKEGERAQNFGGFGVSTRLFFFLGCGGTFGFQSSCKCWSGW